MTDSEEAIRILAGDIERLAGQIERLAFVVAKLVDDLEKHEQNPDAHKP